MYLSSVVPGQRSLSPFVRNLITMSGGDLSRRWFLNKNPAFTASLIALPPSILVIVSLLVAVNSDERLPEAKATRKIDLSSKSSMDISSEVKQSCFSRSKTTFTSHSGMKCLCGGRAKNCARAKRENSCSSNDKLTFEIESVNI